jgi:hypothetical protein
MNATPSDNDAVRSAPPLLERREFARVAVWALVITCLIVSPYLFAWSLAGPDRVFMGHLYNVMDSNAYLAWMNEAAEGRWRFENRYTRTPDKGLFTNVFLLALGKVQGLLGVYPIVVWHAARIVAGWFCLVGIYLLAAFFFDDRFGRWAAMLTAALSSGLGWLFFLGDWHIRAMPFDFGLRSLVQPEANTYLSIYVNPLFAFSMGLMCITFLLFLRGLEHMRYRWVVAAGLCGLVLGNVHTYDMIVLYGTIGVYWLVRLLVPGGPGRHRWARLGMLPAFVGLSIPTVLYQWWVIHVDPIYRAKAQTPTASPGVLGPILGYGLLIVLGLLGVAHILRSARPRGAFLLAWAGIGFLAPYLPIEYFPFQRKMFEGYHIALSLLAAAGLCGLVVPFLQSTVLKATGWPYLKCAKAALIVFLLVTYPSNGCFVWMTMRDAVEDGNAWRLHATNEPPLYLPKDEVAAIRWLRANTSPEDRVLSSFQIGSYIPAWSGNRVLWGHWAETTDLSEAGRIAAGFFNSRIPMSIRELLLPASKCDYVYFGPYERGLANAHEELFDPAKMPALKLVYHGGEVEIFRVVGAPEGAGGEAGTGGPR